MRAGHPGGEHEETRVHETQVKTRGLPPSEEAAGKERGRGALTKGR